MELLDQRCREIEDFSGRLARCGDNLSDLLTDVFPDLDPRRSRMWKPASRSIPLPLQPGTQCAALMLLGQDELKDMLEKDGGAELTCHFCNMQYQVSADELQELISTLGATA